MFEDYNIPKTGPFQMLVESNPEKSKSGIDKSLQTTIHDIAINPQFFSNEEKLLEIQANRCRNEITNQTSIIQNYGITEYEFEFEEIEKMYLHIKIQHSSKDLYSFPFTFPHSKENSIEILIDFTECYVFCKEIEKILNMDIIFFESE